MSALSLFIPYRLPCNSRASRYRDLEPHAPIILFISIQPPKVQEETHPYPQRSASCLTSFREHWRRARSSRPLSTFRDKLVILSSRSLGFHSDITHRCQCEKQGANNSAVIFFFCYHGGNMTVTWGTWRPDCIAESFTIATCTYTEQEFTCVFLIMRFYCLGLW